MPGHLIDGRWEAQTTAATNDGKGAFQRKATSFRKTITPGGEHPPEAGRYHLYVSYACPWAHRTLIFRKLKGLEAMIDVSVVHWLMGDDGWTFSDGPGVIPDPVNNADKLWQVYVKAKADYTGRVTVPVLWDKKAGTIVNNESSEIIRIFNSGFDSIGATPGDYYPAVLRP